MVRNVASVQRYRGELGGISKKPRKALRVSPTGRRICRNTFEKVRQDSAINEVLGKEKKNSDELAKFVIKRGELFFRGEDREGQERGPGDIFKQQRKSI